MTIALAIGGLVVFLAIVLWLEIAEPIEAAIEWTGRVVLRALTLGRFPRDQDDAGGALVAGVLGLVLWIGVIVGILLIL